MENQRNLTELADVIVNSLDGWTEVKHEQKLPSC